MKEIVRFVCLVLAVYFLNGFLNVVEAMPNKAKRNTQATVYKGSESPSNPRTQSSQNGDSRSVLRIRKQEISKPERNKLGDGKKKKRIAGKKRKKSRKMGVKKSSDKKAESDTSQHEDTAQGAKRKRKKQRVECIKTERVDDIPLLVKVLINMGVQKAIDNYIPVQKNQRDLSWGYTGVIWLAYILSTGDHRKVSVQQFAGEMQYTLSKTTGLLISDLDFTDDRLAILTKYLSRETIWSNIEKYVTDKSIEVYEIPQEVVRVDATTVSGYHETNEGELFQFGHSKDDPARPQIKIMTGALDPLGMPVATAVVSGEKADDGLYSPIISRISKTLTQKGLLYVGDCKLSSLDNRLYIREKAQGHYLCPLPNTGKIPDAMKKWIAEGHRKDREGELIEWIVVNEKGEEKLKAKGYEVEHIQLGEIDGKKMEWTERVLVVKSPAHASQQQKGLEKRLAKAEEEIYALTPSRGRGKRQIVDKKSLNNSVEEVLKKYRVEGLVDYKYVKEIEKKEKYIGRGRGSANREKRIEKKVRFQITKVSRNEAKIDEKIKSYGWKAYVTDVSAKRLGFIDVIRSYRHQYRVERIFNRLKSRLNIAPLHVKKAEQIKGITHLLMLGVRVYTLIEFVVRQSLAERNEKLEGLYPENRKKMTDVPTCERILKIFVNITLTVFKIGSDVQIHIPPLSQTQVNILNHLGLDPSVYNGLTENLKI